MANKKRVYQVGERIKELLAEHLVFSGDKRFTLVTITSVMVTPDLRLAKVYWVVSTLTESDKQARIDEVQNGLDESDGLLRRMLASKMQMRFVPTLKFYYDDTLDTVEEVDRLFKKVKERDSGAA